MRALRRPDVHAFGTPLCQDQVVLAAARECQGTHERALRMQCGHGTCSDAGVASPPPDGAGPYRAASSATGHGIVRGGGHPFRSAHNAGTHPRRGRRCKSRSHTASRSYAAGPCAVCTARRPPYRSWPATVPTAPSAAPLSSERRATPARPSSRRDPPVRLVLLVGGHRTAVAPARIQKRPHTTDARQPPS